MHGISCDVEYGGKGRNCPYCGEMSLQSLKRDFCGRENEEVVHFWKQLQ